MQARANAYGEIVGDLFREREAQDNERRLERGFKARPGAVIDQVVADTSAIDPLPPEIRRRSQWIARRAAARATRTLTDVGFGEKPYHLRELNVNFSLNIDESDDDAIMRLSAEIVRKAVGRWRHHAGLHGDQD